MFLSLISAVVMIEEVPDEIPPEVSMQRGLMERFFHKVKQEDMYDVSNGMPLLRICEWNNFNLREPSQAPISRMKCADGILQTFTLHCRFYRYAIAYVPNMIEEIHITSANFHCAMNTRQLPLRARSIMLGHNRIIGSIDLSTLPPALEEFSVSMNWITGTIALNRLPRGLKALHIGRNRIEQKTVYYGDLHPEFQAVLIFNKIGRVCPIKRRQKAPEGTFVL